MELNFFKKKRDSFLVLDIGTEAVKVLIFKNDNNKILILGSAVKYFEEGDFFGNLIDLERYEAEKIKRTVSKCLDDCFKESISCSKKDIPVLLTLSPRVLKSEIFKSSFTRKERERKISKKEQENIYGQVLENAKKDILQKAFKKSGIMPEDVIFNFLEIIGKEIEGYKVNDIKGYQGKCLNFKILGVFSLKRYFENIQNILKEQGLNVLNVFHLSQAIVSGFESFENGVFLDVGGEVSQLFLFKNRKLEKIELVDAGGNDFTESILNVLKTNQKDARILKEKHCLGSLTSEVESKVKEIFVFEKKVWEKKLEKYSDLPAFLSGGGSNIPEIKNVFKKGEKINIKSFKQVEDLTKKVKNPQFIPLILISLFYAKKVF